MPVLYSGRLRFFNPTLQCYTFAFGTALNGRDVVRTVNVDDAFQLLPEPRPRNALRLHPTPTPPTPAPTPTTTTHTPCLGVFGYAHTPPPHYHTLVIDHPRWTWFAACLLASLNLHLGMDALRNVALRCETTFTHTAYTRHTTHPFDTPLPHATSTARYHYPHRFPRLQPFPTPFRCD